MGFVNEYADADGIYKYWEIVDSVGDPVKNSNAVAALSLPGTVRPSWTVNWEENVRLIYLRTLPEPEEHKGLSDSLLFVLDAPYGRFVIGIRLSGDSDKDLKARPSRYIWILESVRQVSGGDYSRDRLLQNFKSAKEVFGFAGVVRQIDYLKDVFLF